MCGCLLLVLLQGMWAHFNLASNGFFPRSACTFIKGFPKIYGCFLIRKSLRCIEVRCIDLLSFLCDCQFVGF